MTSPISQQGIPASRGIAIGQALLWAPTGPRHDKRRIDEHEISREIERLQAATSQTKSDLEEMKQRLLEQGSAHGTILEAQAMLLQDPILIEGARQKILHEKINAEWALQDTGTKIQESFLAMEQPFFRERLIDVEAVITRIIHQLVGEAPAFPSDIATNTIIIAHNISPIDAIELLESGIIGFATDEGSHTSHTAIIARSLDIPAVVSLQNITGQVQDGQSLILDGNEGVVIVDPTASNLSHYENQKDAEHAFQMALQFNRNEPACTLDGHLIQLRGNIDFLQETEAVNTHGGEGIGLLRTEYLFLERQELPDEEAQLLFYQEAIERAHPNLVTFRTLDIGGDKFTPNQKTAHTLNPFLTMRAIRYCLEEKTLFKTQLRALLRASAMGPCRILIPFISNMQEVLQVKEFIHEIKEELRAEGTPFADDLPLGIMIEIPSAALIADQLAKEVDFFSVGTNDLIQYTLALSREIDEARHLYQPLHPALLRLLLGITKGGHAAGIPVGMCGEMASVPHYTQILLAMGFNELSMTPRNIPLIKQIVLGSTMEGATSLLEEILELNTGADIERIVRDVMVSQFPDLISREIQK